MAHPPGEVNVTPCSLDDLLREGWKNPLILLGDALNEPDTQALIRRTYRNPAPCLVLPPLPLGDVTALLDAPAPVTVIRHRADTLELTDEPLREAIGRDSLRIYCTEAFETALRTGTLATANNKPVIWTYQPTRAATPVAWVAPQLLLVSARTDPLDREALLSALLAWAHAQIQAKDARERVGKATPETKQVDPGLLRALVVAWAVRPDLTHQTLPTWLKGRLFVQTDSADLAAGIQALRSAGALDSQDRPQMERLSSLVDELGLRAWVREARQIDEM
jgi:hypothetical protein